MFERFTDRARRVVVLAQEEARLLNHNYIGTEHILLGLLHEGESPIVALLEQTGATLPAVRAQVEDIIGRASHSPTGFIPFTPRAKKVLELALRESLALEGRFIGPEHVLLGLLREASGNGGVNKGVAHQTLLNLGIDLAQLDADVRSAMSDHPEAFSYGWAPSRACQPREDDDEFTRQTRRLLEWIERHGLLKRLLLRRLGLWPLLSDWANAAREELQDRA